eukprot:m.596496 g.596496  ORF g.596496 m.596496 type:complete len:140 (-) comp22411_c0_seq3:188-607(-)
MVLQCNYNDLSASDFASDESGSLMLDIIDAVQMIGLSETIVPALQPAQEFRHTFGLVCIAAGAFQVSYHCESVNDTVHDVDGTDARQPQFPTPWAFGDKPSVYRSCISGAAQPTNDDIVVSSGTFALVVQSSQTIHDLL